MFSETIIDDFFIPTNNSTAYGPVFLIKENGVTTEQNFIIIIQVYDAAQEGTNPATFAGDYVLTRVFSIAFLATQSRLNIGLSLLPDSIPEGTESFLASSSRARTTNFYGRQVTLPEYLSPTYTSGSTFINILDDDRKFTLCYNPIYIPKFLFVVLFHYRLI